MVTNVKLNQIKDPTHRRMCIWVREQFPSHYQLFKNAMYELETKGVHPQKGGTAAALIKRFRSVVIRRVTEDPLVYRSRMRMEKARNIAWDFVESNIGKFSNVVPTSKSIGYEAEMIFKSYFKARDFVKWALENANAGSIQFATDSSVKPTHGDKMGVGGREIRIVCKYDEMDTVMKPILDKLDECAYVNNTCGGHVHFDMRDKHFHDVLVYGMRLRLAQKNLALLCKEERRQNGYCKVNDKRMPVKRAHLDGEERYSFINLKSYREHKTVEVRGLEGCLDYAKLKTWVDVIVNTMSKTTVDTDSLEGHLASIGMNHVAVKERMGICNV